MEWQGGQETDPTNLTLGTIMKLPPKSTNIRIIDRSADVAVWFDTAPLWGGENCFRSFSSRELAERFAAGEEVIPAPEKGERVRLTTRAAYAGPDEAWTERQTAEEILSASITAYHFGRKTKSWRPQMTCFYRRWPDRLAEIPSGTFIAEIPPGTAVQYFDDDEIRVDLAQPGIKIWLAA